MFTTTQNLNVLTTNRLVLAAVACGLLGMSSIVQADVLQASARSGQVLVKDLDLASAQGQRIALQRVRQMARTLCSQVSDASDLSKQTNYVACIDAAVAKANQNLQAIAGHKAATMLAQNQVK